LKTIYNIRPKGLNVGNDAIAVAIQNFIYEASGELVNIITIPATNKYDGGGISYLTQPLAYIFPSLAYQIFCVKEIEHKLLTNKKP
jgi:hypothetical protein